MTDPKLEQLEDHAVGVELQIVELVEQRERAMVQGREAEAARLQAEIESLQFELAGTAEETALIESTSDADDDASVLESSTDAPRS